MPTRKIPSVHTALVRRYLTWAYKSTKESFDRLERKTTQLMADDHILADMKARPLPEEGREEYARELADFEAYVANKRCQPVPQGRHTYLRHRLAAIEKTIVHFLGRAELDRIRKAYEIEFTRRIWASTEH